MQYDPEPLYPKAMELPPIFFDRVRNAIAEP